LSIAEAVRMAGNPAAMAPAAAPMGDLKSEEIFIAK
jgi:hypothetical protein